MLMKNRCKEIAVETDQIVQPPFNTQKEMSPSKQKFEGSPLLVVAIAIGNRTAAINKQNFAGTVISTERSESAELGNWIIN